MYTQMVTQMSRRIAVALVAFLLCSFLAQAQLNTLFVRLIGPNTDQPSVVYLWKQMPNQSYKANAKQFRRQTMISLDPGKYVLSVEHMNRPIFQDVLYLGEESCIVFNIYTKPTALATANFDSLNFATPGMLNLANRRVSYMDF